MVHKKISYPLLIDGGLSNELEKAGYKLNHKLWSAKLLDFNPNAIAKVHLDYLLAGAKCITTSSYQATIPGFMEIGFDRTTAKEMLLNSVYLAELAIENFLNSNDVDYQPLIAASIGPYGAYLADGSEYIGDYKISDDQLNAFHLSRIEILDNSNADFFACETIPSFQEARVLGEMLKYTQKRAWVSFSCKDENTINDGTPIGECVNLFARHPNVFAIGVNCTAPKYISGLIKHIKAQSGEKKIIVYPNSGQTYNAKSKSWQGFSDIDSFSQMAQVWLELGANIIGGCCRIGPKHIKALSEMMNR